MKILVTGGAGFIGSNLVGELLGQGHLVTAYDNLYLGKKTFIQKFLDNPRFKFLECDLLNLDSLIEHSKGIDLIFHLAANSDISLGRKQTDLDFRLGTLTTFNVLEAMRINTIPDLIFASTSAIYGEATVIPTHEDYGPLQPISLYGASKLAAESIISAFAHNFNLRAWIYRFGNVVGPNSTHGVIFDFVGKLIKNSTELTILGDGTQAKPYIYVQDCIKGMLWGYAHSKNNLNVYNLSTDGFTTVRNIAQFTVDAMKLKSVNFNFTGGKRGWVGDVPQVRLCNKKLSALGWAPDFNSDKAVQKAIEHIVSSQCGEH